MKDRGCKEVVLLFNRNRKEQQLRQVSCNTTSYCDAIEATPVAANLGPDGIKPTEAKKSSMAAV
jgi:hypothetical protein